MLVAKIFRLWNYFKRGHSAVLAILIGMLNFVVIQYRLVIEKVPIFAILFPGLLEFVISFGILYLTVAVFVGWLDFKKGPLWTEQELTIKANPFVKDFVEFNSLLCQALIAMNTDRKEEAMECLARAQALMEKWNIKQRF